MRLLLDTHAIIWLTQDERRLGQKARAACESAFAAGDLLVSTVSYYEIVDLIRKKRLAPAVDVDQWRQRLLQTGVVEVPVSGTIAVTAGRLEAFHRDPWDRMIVATALAETSAVVTGDEEILEWRGTLQRLDARR
ncbi:MAG: type II toxin-antitoxin system VapC family toxin [Alphaproteobacteria bacterium]|nr:type II toxin-antitoxin system VapC family toxin [Alphaproteobacteria bacterium]MCW5742109.1 type II toxin-antitoxin system VapC family toxin [Alphaproteobacteria bacterium]